MLNLIRAQLQVFLKRHCTVYPEDIAVEHREITLALDQH